MDKSNTVNFSDEIAVQQLSTPMLSEVSCKSLNETLFNLCLRRMVDSEKAVPIYWTLPVYGYLMPLLIVLTVLTNGVVVAVLRRREMRSPTNYVLMALSITELATGLSTLPWLLHHYTLRGYEGQKAYGMDWFWCRTHAYFATHLPSLCHTASCWLTVYLAFQRYIYVCRPRHVHRYCTIGAARRVFVGIVGSDVAYHLLLLFSSYQRYTTAHPDNPLYRNVTLPYPGGRRLCLHELYAVVEAIGPNLYFNTLFWCQALLAHVATAALLTWFTYHLINELRRADERYAMLKTPSRHSIAEPKLQVMPRNDVRFRRCSSATNVILGGGPRSPLLGRRRQQNDRQMLEMRSVVVDICAGVSQMTTVRSSSALVSMSPEGRGAVVRVGTNPPLSVSSSTLLSVPPSKQSATSAADRRLTVRKQNPRMLIIIIVMFLLLELPVACLKVIHALFVTLDVNVHGAYTTINILLMLRNVLLLLMYPLRLVIYCSMSMQFRQTARKLFPLLFDTKQPPDAAEVELATLRDKKRLRPRSTTGNVSITGN